MRLRVSLFFDTFLKLIDTQDIIIREATKEAFYRISERKYIPPAPKVDLEKLAELEGPELAELVKLYMTENEALRQENSQLFSTREVIMRDQELVCRENERLLKKLEDVNS